MLFTLLCAGRFASFISLCLWNNQIVQLKLGMPRGQEHFAREPWDSSVQGSFDLPASVRRYSVLAQQGHMDLPARWSGPDNLRSPTKAVVATLLYYGRDQQPGALRGSLGALREQVGRQQN